MKNNTGAISIFALIAMLFFLAFIMVSYNTVQEKGKTQQGTTGVLTEIYDQDKDINAVYSKMYSNTAVDFNTIVKTEEQENVINNANFIAVDGVIYKKSN